MNIYLNQQHTLIALCMRSTLLTTAMAETWRTSPDKVNEEWIAWNSSNLLGELLHK